MRLIDFATKVSRGSNEWYPGWDSEQRSCVVSVQLTDVCGPNPDLGDIINSTPASPTNYPVIPFATTARIDRAIPCAADDEEEWLKKEMDSEPVIDVVLGRALCTEHAEGTETWIGSLLVTVEAVTGTLDSHVIAARRTWVQGNSGVPALHVDPDLVPSLITADVLTEDGQLTVWGDPVVVSGGYLAGTLFWSGPITYYIGDSQVDSWISAPENKMAFNGTRMMAVDMSPCAVVRVGDTPVDPSPIVTP